MFHNVRFYSLVALLMFACGQLSGCAEECKTGATECINGELIRTCVPTADDNEWMISQCPENSSCVDDGATADAGTSGDSAAVAACVGTCVTGESECVDDSLARFCVSGGVWQLDMCEVGEKCVSGKCTIGEGDGSVQACTPGAKQCASDLVEKVCDPDGTAWVQQPCGANEICVDTECVADPASSCDDGNQCLDNTHAIRCLGQDQGFTVVDCPANTYCLGGVCRGSVCAIGSFCAGPNQVRNCVDGESFVDTQCAVNEVCEQRPDSDTASCVPRECDLNTTVCGDPRDPSVDTTQFFTTCVTSNVTGNPAWATGECTGLTTCDPAVLVGAGGVESPCRQDCTPGAQRCTGVGGTATGIGAISAIQTCGPDGEWLPAENCNAGTATYLQCALTVSADASQLPTAVCAAPTCAAVFNYNNANMDPLTDLEGACTETGEIQRCNADGTLAKAAACDNYTCTPGSLGVQADGRTPGLCPKTPVCEDGDEQCVWDGSTPTPYYQTCVNGFWSNALETCANDGLCYPASTDGTGKICGAECVPGSHKCDPLDPDGRAIQTCNDKGKLGDPAECDKGLCGFSSLYSDAICILECVPGEQVCLGSATLAADYVHYGTDMTATCGSDGLLNTAVSCSAGTTCRESSTGVVLGCVECVGTGVPGGNEDGINDTACDIADNTRIMECGADNTYTGRDCSGGKTCQGGGMLGCGSCFSAFGLSLSQCSEALVNDAEYCDTCAVVQNDASVVYVQCTEANILGTGNAVSTTCAGNGFGTPTNISGSVFGNVTGCCSSSLVGSATCSSEGYGTAMATFNVADCCSDVVYSTGSGIAYCAEP